MKNIIILASGNGTNYQYITDCISQLNLDINIVALVCDKINAPVVQKANENKHRIIIRESQGQKRDRYDLELVSDILNLVSACWIGIVVMVLNLDCVGTVFNHTRTFCANCCGRTSFIDSVSACVNVCHAMTSLRLPTR